MAIWIENLVEQDQRLFAAISGGLTQMKPGTRRVLRVISHLGDGHLWALLAGMLWITQGVQGRHAFFAGAAACISALLLFRIIKNRVARQRPDSSLQTHSRLLVPLDQYSFPSGHSATSMATALTLGAFFPTLLAPLVTLSLLISFSRVALKVHYPLDIVAGWTLGVTTALLSLLFLR